MARKMERSAEASSSKKSVAEIKDIYENQILRYESADNALKILRDVNKATNRTINNTNKTNLRNWLQNIGSNESNLRGLSRYLYYRSHIYFRLIKFFANMFDLTARSVIPNYDMTKDNDKDKTIKSYYETLKIIDKMNLQSELIKMYVIALREDVAFGCVYFDEDNGLFIMPLDPDYCKIDGNWYTGDFSFKFDVSYWRSRQDQIELIGDPWISMWNLYQQDTKNNRWQSLPPENMFALKFRSEDYDLVVPPFSGMFNALLSLIGLEDLQSVWDEQQIYKLVYMPMETISGSKNVDDWCVSPDLIAKYMQRLQDTGLPEDYTTAAIVPGKELKILDFSDDAARDVDRVNSATKTLLDTSGGSELLLGSNINNTAAFNAAMKANTEFAISTLLPQTQAWVNRFITYYVSNPSFVKFMEISIYTRDDYRKTMLESAQYGLPNKLAYNTLNGYSELQTLSLNFLEEECLGLTDKFRPLQSSYTQSGNNNDSTYNPETGQGAPMKDDTDLKEEGGQAR